jgi:hypothetical protein
MSWAQRIFLGAIISGALLSAIYRVVSEAGERTTSSSGRPTSKLTKENFLRVQIGMSYSDVKLILGEPTRILNQNGKLTEPVAYEYIEGNKEATVFLSPDGIVFAKSQKGLD